MEETTFLAAGSTVVTSTRIEIDGQTFAVRNIGSVKVEGGGRPWLGVLFGIFGVGVMRDLPIFGVCLLVIAAYAMWQKFALRKLVLVSGGGETVALKSTNAAAVEALRAAIAQAIAAR
jgi:hypothetical protein